MLYTAILIFQSSYLLLMVKMLIHKNYVNIEIKDCLLVLFSGISTGLLYPHIGILVSPILVVLICFYNYKLCQYRIKKSIFLSTLTMLIAILFDHVTSIFLSLIFNETVFNNYHLFVFHLPISALLASLFTFLFTKTTKKIRMKINQNKQLQIILTSISTLILFSFYGSIILATHIGNYIELIELNLIFFGIYSTIGLIVFYFYSKTLREKYEIQRNQDEQEILKKYTQEIETQYTKMRKFKHDYQNILSSLDDYIENKDHAGLKDYYLNKIKPTSGVINQHQFALEPLSRIQIREIKSILSVKLMIAQDFNINVTFEAPDEISHISLDSIVLVRSLGILLDNAIEELTSLENGILRVGVLKDENSTMFVVQNTCRHDIDRLHKLKQLGFSTKGKNRGIGLNNLADFAKANANMRIETSIIKSQFTQKIIIGA